VDLLLKGEKAGVVGGKKRKKKHETQRVDCPISALFLEEADRRPGKKDCSKGEVLVEPA